MFALDICQEHFLYGDKPESIGHFKNNIQQFITKYGRKKLALSRHQQLRVKWPTSY